MCDGTICKRLSDLWREMRTLTITEVRGGHKSAYTFDNVSLCAKDENPLLRKELAASIEVKS